MLNPCARESKARTGRFLREKLTSYHDLLASPAQGLHHHGPRYFNFPFFGIMLCGLEKLGLVDQN